MSSTISVFHQNGKVLFFTSFSKKEFFGKLFFALLLVLTTALFLLRIVNHQNLTEIAKNGAFYEESMTNLETLMLINAWERYLKKEAICMNRFWV